MMNKVATAFMTCVLCAGLSITGQGEVVADKLKAVAPMSAKSGGLVVKAASGRFVCFSTQTRYSDAEVSSLLKLFSNQIRFQIALVKGTPFDVKTAGATARQSRAEVGLFLIDDGALPMTLVAMEDRWAVINVAKIASPDASRNVNVKRLQRAISRTLKALFSSVSTKRDARAVTSGADLDLITSDPIDGPSLFNIVNGLPSVGLVPERVTTYKRACEEGWAPAPTNEYQKAIWDKVHAMPTEPIKIKPETKKVRE